MRSSVVCAALVVLVFAGGCSKRPTAPPIAAPTRFLVFSSDRGRLAGSYRNFVGTFEGATEQENPRGALARVIDRHPSLTQDARFLAFTSQDSASGDWNVYVYDRSANSVGNDANVNSALDEVDPCISLDGSMLAFVRDSAGTQHIRLYDLAAHRFVPLPGLEAPGFSDWEPSLDRAGHRIAFTTNRNGSTDVMVYQVATHTLITSALLADPAAGDQQPGISGDGRFVAFSSNRAGGVGGFDLYVFDLNNLFLVNLPANVNSDADETDPSMSMDGSNLVFVSNRVGGSGGWDLWNFDRVGAVLKQVNGLSSSADDLEPAVVWP